MTPIPATWSTVDALADDPSIVAALDHDSICRAILAANAAHGRVTAATVRANLDRDVNPHRIGAVMSVLARRGVLKRTRRIALSGNTAQRNGQRLMPVYKITDLGRVA